ncbi:MAG: RagB/SusD family nutrient uptake outer membrane protein, partial [Chitinophagaceae bacterium]|nr:RagB/SusD family nutrient uptake outer membrane protein [Chitinophagaceae bacterium]
FTRARINKSGAEMLLGKIYLYMGKFDQALVQFNNAVNDLPQGNSLTPMALYDYNTTLAPAGPWSYNPATSPNTYLFGYPQNLVNTENLLVRQFTNNWSHFSNDLLLNTSTYALYGANDTRKRLYSTKAYSGSSTLQPGVYRKIAPQFANLGLNLPDLYLMRAECKARTGDIGGAKDDLEMLTTKRMPVLEASVPSGLTQEQMIRFVLDERLREFAMLGYRWFDMRRLSVDPLFSSNTYSHQYLKSDGSVGATFVLRPERLTLRFPAKLLAQNPGMPNNP